MTDPPAALLLPAHIDHTLVMLHYPVLCEASQRAELQRNALVAHRQRRMCSEATCTAGVLRAAVGESGGERLNGVHSALSPFPAPRHVMSREKYFLIHIEDDKSLRDDTVYSSIGRSAEPQISQVTSTRPI